jgi:phosphate transport system substrate-binding protein
MRRSKLAICLAGASVSVPLLGGAPPAAALDGCFCARQDEADRICGEIIKYDRENLIVVRPPGKARRSLEPVEFVECREPPPRLRCASGQTVSNGQCIALPAPPAVQPPPARFGFTEGRTAEGNAPSPAPAVSPAPAPPEPVASPKDDEQFGIAGSNTIGEKLMPALIEAFGKSQGFVPYGNTCAETRFRLRRGASTLSIACSSHGTRTGIPALAGGEADIAMLSRPINAEEQARMREVGYPNMDSVRHEIVVALDGLLIIVAPQNPVRALTVDQIAGVFAGEITDWAQLGATPGTINLYVRDQKSGTRDSFDAMVMAPHAKRISGAARSFESSSEISDKVAVDPRGIGFVGFAYQRRARALPIAQPCGLAHEPSPLAIKAEDYPLSRRLFLYTAKQHSIHSSDLVHYALSAAAQPVIEGAGYVNQTIASWSDTETKARVAGYAAKVPQEPGLDRDASRLRDLRTAAEGAERLSISFRFRANSTKLDTKAWQDVLRLAEHMKTVARNRRVLLLGFADSQGSFGANLTLSRARANEVRTSLLGSGAGLAPDLIEAKGYSELMPVACNVDEVGRAKNRRVEVWLAAR